MSDVRDKIRKLLAVAADDAATQGEIENAMRAAEALMMAHRITEDELRKLPAGVQAEIRYARQQCWTEGKLTLWEQMLGHFVVKFVGPVGFYVERNKERRTDAGVLFTKNGKPVRATRVTFYGPDDDAMIATELFEELSRTIIAMSRLKFGGTFRGPGRSYAEGFVSGLGERLNKAIEQVKESSDGRALVVRNGALVVQQRNEARQWLKREMGVKLVNVGGSSGGQYHGNAYGAGQADGRNASVTKRQPVKRLGCS